MSEDIISKLESRVSAIEERNSRVETDKRWETSGTRKVLIFVMTYVVAAVWLVMIQDANPFLKACVPGAGWYLSTRTLPAVKAWWVAKYTK